MTRRGLSARTGFVAVLCSVLIVAATTVPAGATDPAPTRIVPVNGRISPLVDDPSCPPNVEFPSAIEQSRRGVGLVKTRIGPAAIVADVCWFFVGAIGGEDLRGTFSLIASTGTLSGTADGVVGFAQQDHYGLTLTVDRGTWLFRHVRGTLEFGGTVDRGLPGFAGQMNADLHVQLGRHQFPVPLI